MPLQAGSHWHSEDLRSCILTISVLFKQRCPAAARGMHTSNSDEGHVCRVWCRLEETGPDSAECFHPNGPQHSRAQSQQRGKPKHRLLKLCTEPHTMLVLALVTGEQSYLW